jgi:hypothetical protein
MQVVSLRNPELLRALNEMSEWVFSQDQSLLESFRTGNIGTTSEYACSYEYLETLQKEDIHNSGYPQKSVGFDVNRCPVKISDKLKTMSSEMDKKMISILGVGFNALKMYYPADGYISWHHNANCPGQNLIMTYSPPGGKGYFEYQDPATKEFVRMHDPEGWSAKVGYFAPYSEPDKIFWHCARSVNTPRMTISYVIRDQWMWDEMVQDIESDQ